MKDLIPEGVFLLASIVILIIAIIFTKSIRKQSVYSITTPETSMIEDIPRNLPEPKPVKEVLIYYREYATPSDAEKGLALMAIEESTGEYCGGYQLTAYIATGSPCADGNYPSVGYTAASNDPELWHRRIRIEGYGDYYIHDTGGMASNVIDIFVGSYDEAISFGRQYGEVFIIE